MNELILNETGNVTANSFESLIESFVSSLDVMPTSRQTYEKGLRCFLSWLKTEGISSPVRADVLRYRDILQSQGLTAATINTYVTSVRLFFQWTESEAICPDISRGVKGLRKPKGFRKDALTVSQTKELLCVIDRSTPQGKRDHAVVNLMARTGLRSIEVVRASIGDLTQEGGEAVLRIQGKGRSEKDEFVVITGDTLKPITDYLSERGPTEDAAPLFASISDRNQGGRLSTRTIRRLSKQHLRAIGLNSKRITCHSLRHTAITLSLLGGASIQEAQVLGRHANVNTTLAYAHNINRVVNAAERRIDALLSAD